MPRKTLKHQSSGKAVHTIPQLRRLFEHIEEFVDARIHKRESKESLSKELRKEWKLVFKKVLDKKAADEFVDGRMKSKKILQHTRKGGKTSGGGGPLAGAPLDYTTRPGVYIQPSHIPVNGLGHGLPTLSGGGYGHYNSYVNSGFWNPEDSQGYDPVQGQQAWPVPYASTGSNAVLNAVVNPVMKGGKRRLRGGNALLDQAFQRPFGADNPSAIVQDLQSMAYGQTTGPSPDQVQRQVTEVQPAYRVS
jgi:hypothetical protein